MQDRLATLSQIGEERLSKRVLTDAEQREFQISAAMLEEADLARIVSSASTALNEDRNFYGTSESLQLRLPPAIETCKATAKVLIELARRAGSKANTVTSAEFVEAGSAARRASLNLWKVAVDE